MLRKMLSILLAAAMLLGTFAAIAEGSSWICPECGAENTMNFCGNCGAKRPTSANCPSCGFEIALDAAYKFCPNCGANLNETASQPEVSTPGQSDSTTSAQPDSAIAKLVECRFASVGYARTSGNIQNMNDTQRVGCYVDRSMLPSDMRKMIMISLCAREGGEGTYSIELVWPDGYHSDFGENDLATRSTSTMWSGVGLDSFEILDGEYTILVNGEVLTTFNITIFGDSEGAPYTPSAIDDVKVDAAGIRVTDANDEDFYVRSMNVLGSDELGYPKYGLSVDIVGVTDNGKTHNMRMVRKSDGKVMTESTSGFTLNRGDRAIFTTIRDIDELPGEYEVYVDDQLIHTFLVTIPGVDVAASGTGAPASDSANNSSGLAGLIGSSSSSNQNNGANAPAATGDYESWAFDKALGYVDAICDYIDTSSSLGAGIVSRLRHVTREDCTGYVYIPMNASVRETFTDTLGGADLAGTYFGYAVSTLFSQDYADLTKDAALDVFMDVSTSVTRTGDPFDSSPQTDGEGALIVLFFDYDCIALYIDNVDHMCSAGLIISDPNVFDSVTPSAIEQYASMFRVNEPLDPKIVDLR